MKRHFAQAALALALVVWVAMPAAAVDRTSSEQRLSEQRAAVRSDVQADSQKVRLSKLLGMAVVDRTGKTVGTVKDVVLDTSSGRVHYAVLARGGFANVGEKLFAVPLSQLSLDAERNLVLAADKEQLDSTPEFENGRWPNWNEGRYRAQIDERYAVPPAPNAKFRRASDVMKTKVTDSHGGAIGDVQDMVVDLGASRIDYVLVKFDRAWTPDDKLVALPPSAFIATPTQRNPPAQAAAPPRNSPPVLAFESSEPTKGTASAVNPPGSIETRPPPIDPGSNANVRPLEPEPLKTTTSYADDENLVYKGERADLLKTPAFDTDELPK
jgi:sporulation protein YlmC with PRC-barrel domain